MNRSLMIILVLGLLAMVFLAGMGSFFVGKVGGAENVGPLRSELKTIYRHQMESPEDLTIRIVREESDEGVIVGYAPSATMLRDQRNRDRNLRRLADFILGQPEWQRLTFVEIHLKGAEATAFEARFERTALNTVTK